MLSDQSVLVGMEIWGLNDMSFFCPPLGFRKIQTVNEAVQEIQVQVNLPPSCFMVTGFSCYQQRWTTTTAFI